jgi:hypothetical protein
MARGSVFLLVACAGWALAACGSRTELESTPPSVPHVEDAGACVPACTGKACGAGDGCGGTCTCVCTPTPFPSVTSLSSEDELGLDSVAVDGTTVFVASSTAYGATAGGGPNCNFDPAWHVTWASEDLSMIGQNPIVMSFSQAQAVTPGSVAAGFGHRGFMGWDNPDGCRFVALNADATAAGQPTLIGSNVCGSLIATETGFVALETLAQSAAPATLLRLDASGNVLATAPIVGPGPSAVAAPGRSLVRFEDGTLLIAWQSGQSSTVLGMHVSEEGAALAPPSVLFAPPAQTNTFPYFAVASLGTNALAAWGNGNATTLTIEPAAENASPGAATSLTSSWFTFLDVGSYSAGALVAWTEDVAPNTGEPGALTVQSVTSMGAITSPPVSIPGYPNTPPLLVATPTAQLVAFAGGFGNSPGAEFGVFLMPPCSP